MNKQKIWLIMSKDRRFVAKGTPRNRTIVRADDVKNKMRLLTYKSKGMAEAGFTKSGFYSQGLLGNRIDDNEDNEAFLRRNLEAVEFEMTLTEVK